jgi:hypothetical protein
VSARAGDKVCKDTFFGDRSVFICLRQEQKIANAVQLLALEYNGAHDWPALVLQRSFNPAIA